MLEVGTKCELCDRLATVHVTDISGTYVPHHYCEEHAREQVDFETLPYSLDKLDEAGIKRFCDAIGVDAESSSPPPQVPDATMATKLASLLGDPEPCLRYYAAVWIGQLKEIPQDLQIALQATLNDSDPHVRAAAQAALARI